jgi:DNA-directed RNA polymerase subunit RPC12/RpoP
LKCINCEATTFRTSKLRLTDIARLLILQYPVRCRHCGMRMFVGIHLAYRVHRARKLRRQEAQRPMAH